MEKGIVILDGNKKDCMNICSILDEQNYAATPVYSLKNLLPAINEEICEMLILDMDSIEVDKNLFRKLKKENPSLRIVGLSNKVFHPELEDAITKNHIYACISKPVDEEELVFWVKSLF